MKQLSLIIFLLGSLQLAGCASNSYKEPQDPWQGMNRGIYKFNDALDRAILKPVAKGYDKVVPKPIDKGIDNIFSNIGDVVVLFNDILQLKFKQSASDTGRLIVNSTLGLAGIFDVASPLGMPKHNEDFGQTLGHWGAPSGPYLVLPFLGPSSLRDGIGILPDGLIDGITLNEIGIDEPREILVYSGIFTINLRQNLLGVGDLLDHSGADPYIFLRESYLQRRKNLVSDGAYARIEDAIDAVDEDALFGEDE
jgi:phospholipid-binding lipoprotein MlaA